MSFQFTSGRFKGWASDGTPLASGRLYTYASGTTTHKNAFTSATLGTPCTYTSDGVGGLYIALDARGEAQLWLGSGAYTFVLQTSTGASVWTVDGVEDTGRAYDTALRADLASTTDATKGAHILGYKLNYAGSAGRLLNLKLQEWVSITDFSGADPTGATSSDSAFASAVALVTTTSGGMTIEIPNGTFVISNLNLTDKKGLRFRGTAGSVYSVVKVTGKITCNNTGDFQADGVSFVGNVFDTTTRTVTGAATAGNILFDMVDNCANWNVHGCYFYGFDNVFRPNSGATNGSYIINITDNYFGWNNTSILADGVLHWWVENNTFSEDRVCNVWIKTGGGFHVDKNETENSTNALSSGYNFRFGDGSTAVVANGSCDGNNAHQWYGVQLQKITQMSVSDNKGRLCKGARAFSIETSCTSIQVHDNVLNGYDGSGYMAYGVYISAPLERISVKTNQLINFDVGAYVSTPGAYGTAIAGNQIAGVTNSISVTGVANADYVAAYDNEISQGSIKSVGNTAAWIAGPNVFSTGVATQLVNTDGYARTGSTKKAVVNNNASGGYTVSAGVDYVGFTGTNVASLTITLPAASTWMDGQRFSVYTQAAVGTAIVFLSAGATFVGAPATLAAGSVTRFVYNSASTNFLPA